MTNIYQVNSNLSLSKKYKLVENVKECNFIFLTHKIKSKQDKIKYVDENNVEIVKNTLILAKKNNTKLIYLCGGDVPPVILPNIKNVLVLNTSVYKSTMPSNEMIIAPIVEDKFYNYLNDPILSIGFVGQTLHNRDKYLNYLSNSNLKTNFICRDGYIHHLKEEHITEFDNNMNNNLFTVCYRGRGNYSVRFYETLMRGRIPIVIKTDNIFPFEKWIDYNKIGLFIEETDLNNNMNLEEQINNFYKSKTKEQLIEMQKYNRQIYLTYFKENVFFEKIFEYIETHQ